MKIRYILIAIGALIFISVFCNTTNAQEPNQQLSNIHQLTFEERVACQKAIEKVYWENRIWPKDNKQPKPSFKSLMPESELRSKVDNILRQSNALEYYWQAPIKAEQLQAETNRMAQQTKNPAALKHLWNALNNDPHIIAECLARPILAERLINNWYSGDERFHGQLKARAELELKTYPTLDQHGSMSAVYSEIEYIKTKSGSKDKPDKYDRHHEPVMLNGQEWNQVIDKLMHVLSSEPPIHHLTDAGINNLPTGKLSRLQEDEESYYSIAVLSKASDKIKIAKLTWNKVPFDSWWIESKKSIGAQITETGYSYNLPEIIPLDCTNDTWTPTTNWPEYRSENTAVWTGTEMIIWGGINVSEFYLNTGAKYNPATDTWTQVSITNAPIARSMHTAVWTGTRMIVWGGHYYDPNYEEYFDLDTGGRYDPVNNTWTATSTTNAPYARYGHVAVWTGIEMIIWGGGEISGGRYNPATDTWLNMSQSNEPYGFFQCTAVWIGTDMIVWGGLDYDNTPVNGGGKYNPANDTWTPTPTYNAPQERYAHTAVWTGSEMIIWGGIYLDYFGYRYYLNTGGKYNPAVNSWTPTSTTNAPAERASHSAVWTGTGGRMMIWGGGSDITYCTNSGSKYNPANNLWVPISTNNAPEPRCGHSAVWTGTEMIIWGGGVSTAGRYTPSTNSWRSISSRNIPGGREGHTAVWTGNEMIIWGGEGSGYFKNGGRYYPATDSWNSTSTLNAPEGRINHTAVWTGTKMIIWGGFYYQYDATYFFNTGGKYDPATDSWIATSTVNAPIARDAHTAVWTGNEMIIWGGFGGGTFQNTGGKYNPNSDTWIPTPTLNAPLERISHIAVWTGTEMIIWGGEYAYPLNTGGRYNPTTNHWAETAAPDTLPTLYSPYAVWTGADMIVWGYADYYSNPEGYIYNPSSDSWTEISLVNAPTNIGPAVWTGNEMIIWTGNTDYPYDIDGGRYNPLTDSWTPMSEINSPLANEGFSAVWTGTQMIIWGGWLTNSGSLYCAATQGSPLLSSQKPYVNDSTSGNGNGIIEMNEPVELTGSIINLGSNQACAVSGMLTTTDPVTITKGTASYPDIVPGSSQNCTSCYQIIAPSANRPATHWDFSVTETVHCASCAPAIQNFIYHVGNSFMDIPSSYLFYPYIEKIFHAGITSGCSSTTFCPSSIVLREQMAKFICNSINSTIQGSCSPAACTSIFGDVPASNPFCGYIEALYNLGIVTGCQSSPLLYCPLTAIQRQAMAKIVCEAMQMSDPASCIPFACSGIFNDVNLSNPFCFYIEALYNAGIISGCASSYFCPLNAVSRDQMAKFLVNAFGFTL